MDGLLKHVFNYLGHNRKKYSVLNAKKAIEATLSIQEDNIKVMLDDKQIEFPDALPIIKNGRVLVPLRSIANSLNFKIQWDENDSKMILSKENITIEMYIGNPIFKILDSDKGTEEKLVFIDNITPIIENSHTYLPLRALGEALDINVEWNENTKTAILKRK